MSAIKTLNRKYGKFFTACCVYSVVPYLETYGFLADPESPIQVDPTLGCLVLSIIPVLPALTLVTFSLALGIALLGLVSMPFAYAGAAIKDAVHAEEGVLEIQTFDDEDYDEIEGCNIAILRSAR